MSSERGQAITLDYTIGIAITVVLITGLLIAGGNYVGDQREQAGEAELRVIGQQIAADIEAADRLVAAGNGGASVQLRRLLPSDVAGSRYRVTLVESADPHLELTSSELDIDVQVEFVNETAVSQSQINGGPILVNLTAADRLALEAGGSA